MERKRRVDKRHWPDVRARRCCDSLYQTLTTCCPAKLLTVPALHPPCLQQHSASRRLLALTPRRAIDYTNHRDAGSARRVPCYSPWSVGVDFRFPRETSIRDYLWSTGWCRSGRRRCRQRPRSPGRRVPGSRTGDDASPSSCCCCCCRSRRPHHRRRCCTREI